MKYKAIDEREQMYIEEGWEQAAIDIASWDWTMGNIAASNASQQNSANIQAGQQDVIGNIG